MYDLYTDIISVVTVRICSMFRVHLPWLQRYFSLSCTIIKKKTFINTKHFKCINIKPFKCINITHFKLNLTNNVIKSYLFTKGINSDNVIFQYKLLPDKCNLNHYYINMWYSFSILNLLIPSILNVLISSLLLWIRLIGMKSVFHRCFL